MNRVFSFNNDIDGSNIEYENFYKLMDICFEVSTYFTLAHNEILRDEQTGDMYELLQKLEPFFIKRIITTDWHRHYVTDENKHIVYLHKVTEESKKIICDTFDNIFLKKRENGELLSLYLLEDLCFFIDKKMFLGTVSHEGYCTVYTEKEEMYNKIKILGDFEEVDFLDDEQIILDI